MGRMAILERFEHEHEHEHEHEKKLEQSRTIWCTEVADGAFFDFFIRGPRRHR